MKGGELETIQKFLKHLALDEKANGSDEVAGKLEQLANTLVPWNTVEDAAEEVYSIYDFYIHQMLYRKK